MSTFTIILFSFFTIVLLVQILDIEIENLPDCWVIRYSNPLTRIRYENVIPKKTS
jgi:prepilin signal peptidase PulO-like enzyme (type II secretory pathway)